MKLLHIMAFAGFAGLASFAAATASAAEFKLSSPTIKPNGRLPIEQVFNEFGCTGKNLSPELSWTPGPKATKSYALTVYDPDAPTGSGWWHWVVFNIPANVTKLPAGAGALSSGLMPAGAVQGRTDFGVAGFGGACPPEGDKPHRYIFTVHALKTASIDLPPEASAALVGFMIHANVLAKATFMARYGR
jgi:Raf kinase inhibitor-like YbhB/YbcL family protein